MEDPDTDELTAATALMACLSSRELEVAYLVADGLSAKEIAYRLRIAPSTAKNRLSGVYAALGESNRVKLARAVWVYEAAR